MRARRPACASRSCRRRASARPAPTAPRSQQRAGGRCPRARAADRRTQHRRRRAVRDRCGRVDPARARAGHPAGAGRGRDPERRDRGLARAAAAAAKDWAAACTRPPATRPTSGWRTTCPTRCRTPRSASCCRSWSRSAGRPTSRRCATWHARSASRSRWSRSAAPRSGRAGPRRTPARWPEPTRSTTRCSARAA